MFFTSRLKDKLQKQHTQILTENYNSPLYNIYFFYHDYLWEKNGVKPFGETRKGRQIMSLILDELCERSPNGKSR